MTLLFSPLKIKDITLRNRIGMSPMCQYSSENGRATDWHIVHLGARAVGGAGLIIAEATAVTPAGRITPYDAGLWSDEHIPPLQRITSFLKQHGTVPGVQIAHAGRKASDDHPWTPDRKQLSNEDGGWTPVAPSAEPFGGAAWKVPHALTIEEISEIQAAFAAAATRALAAGYEFLEIHGAHGYLINSFLSPLGNKRTDEYGGSFVNRTRFLLETVRAVRAVWPERLPLAVRLSVTDWMEGGWTVEDSVAVALLLKTEGVDLIDCSSGGIARGPRTAVPGPSWQVPLAATIKEEAHMLTAAVGEITNGRQAETILRLGQADIILLGKELMRQPYWPYHAARDLGLDTKGMLTPQLDHWIG